MDTRVSGESGSMHEGIESYIEACENEYKKLIALYTGMPES